MNKWAVGLIVILIFIVGCATKEVVEQPSPEQVSAPDTASEPALVVTPEPAMPEPEVNISGPDEICNTEECFLAPASLCEEAELTLTQEAGTFLYQTKDCVLTKTLVKLADGNPQEIRDLLEGKSMTCKYKSGGFDVQWIESLMFGIEYCQGDLKTGLATLLVFD